MTPVPSKRGNTCRLYFITMKNRNDWRRKLWRNASKQSKSIATQILPATEFYVAEDYHQKYMLQHHPWLLESLNINPGEQLISSHVAARLNGYIGGYGKHSDFSAEGPKLGLNEKMVEYVARKMT